MPLSEDEIERIRREDKFARERENLSGLRHGHRVHNTDFYKYIMAFSIAGLGFNISVITGDGEPYSPFYSLGLSTIFFLAVIALTLLLFFLTALHFEVQTRIEDRYTNHPAADDRRNEQLIWWRQIIAALIILSFLAAVIFSALRII